MGRLPSIRPTYKSLRAAQLTAVAPTCGPQPSAGLRTRQIHPLALVCGAHPPDPSSSSNRSGLNAEIRARGSRCCSARTSLLPIRLARRAGGSTPLHISIFLDHSFHARPHRGCDPVCALASHDSPVNSSSADHARLPRRDVPHRVPPNAATFTTVMHQLVRGKAMGVCRHRQTAKSLVRGP